MARAVGGSRLRPVPPELEMLTATQVWQVYGFSYNTLRRWEAQGHLTPFREGRMVRYRRSAIEALLREREMGGASE